MSRRSWPATLVFICAMAVTPMAHAAEEPSRPLVTFEDISPWQVVASDDVSARVTSVGNALRLDFNFNGKAGWAMTQRPLPLDLPENFEIVVRIRGTARPNDFQFKLTDAKAENVWWFRQADYAVSQDWSTLRIRRSDIEFAWGPTNDRALRHTEAVEFGFAAGHGGGSGALEIAEMSIRELPPGAPEVRQPSPNDVLMKLAQRSPRGMLPRPWVGEQNYWTIVGVDGGNDEGMLSEDGAFELRKAAPSLEPFLTVDGISYDWSKVEITQSLRDRYLPMPAVRWAMRDGGLNIKAFGAGERGSDYAIVRYEYSNTSQRAQDVALAIAVRPMQVNPATQFLNGVGGAAPIRELQWDGRVLQINGSNKVLPTTAPDTFVAKTFDAAPTPELLLKDVAKAAGRSGDPAPASASGAIQLVDESAFASAAFVYRRKVAAGASFEVAMLVPWTADIAQMPTDVAGAEQRTADTWHRGLDGVGLRGPAALRPVFDTMRTALAHILINRDGPGLQPGSRSYERSWIRDGALSSASLLRLGHTDTAAEFMNWYSHYLFSNGKVPCCVDFRGADPVPENDSNGEFIWLASELYRFTRDEVTLRHNWPRIQAAVGYLEKLRLSERTEANKGTSLYGLLPASISHEGYSAKAMHSYWDDFWGIAGYDAAVEIARALNEKEALRQWSASRKQFREDVRASLLMAMKERRIDYIPGAAELGDFDATSTTIALSPVGAQAVLPEPQLRNTFERYWQDFSARRDDWAHSGARDGAGAANSKWPVYTPYEIRTIGSFLRLGWRDRADELLAFFMLDRRPAGWNQWAEVVGREPRAPRFIGDMPHGWVASDFIRSVLDMFAYERENQLVLAAGIDPRWLDGEGIGIERLRTPWGLLSYSLKRGADGKPDLKITGDAHPPRGFILALAGEERAVGSARP